jgi:hypothetical protein
MTKEAIKAYVLKHYHDGMLVQCAYDEVTYAEYKLEKIAFLNNGEVWLEDEDVYIYDCDKDRFADRYIKVTPRELIIEKI